MSGSADIISLIRSHSMSRSSEFETICFQQNPCGVLVMDIQRTVLQLNPALESMLGLPASRLVGKNHETVQPNAYQCLLKGEGLTHLTGTGIEQEKWFLCKEFEGSTQIFKFFEEVTEQVKLKQENSALQQQVEELTITDELTGLANPRALNRALSSQVTRSRRYNNPLCLAVLELVDESNPEASLSDETILTASRHLRDRLRWVDTIARWDHNHFVVILPETKHEDGNDLIGKISASFTETTLPPVTGNHTLKLRFGLAQWMKGNDSRLLMERAALALNSSREEQFETAAI